MAHLIDKSALVAEIERRLEFVEKRLKRNNSYTEEGNTAWKRDKALYDNYNSFLSFLDTLEVKEVDLEKETKKWWKKHLHLDPKNQLWMDAHQSIVFAKHFFELGLKAQKGEEV